MKRFLWQATLIILAACGVEGQSGEAEAAKVPPPNQPVIRLATFNVSLYRDAPDALYEDLSEDIDPQLEAVRRIIRRVSPDILVINEFDYDETGRAIRLFAEQLDAGYTYHLALPSNTGVLSGVDFDRDGTADHRRGTRGYGQDSFGYGTHPGQYAFAVLSRYPLVKDKVRTFQKLLWRDMPDHLMPQDYYSKAAQAVFRLSSKNHVDVPIDVDGQRLHMIIAHPTPPGFDGDEDRNGRRNHDEIRLLHDYATMGEGGWMIDDKGVKGGLEAGAFFAIAGDLNADPADGDRVAGQPRHAIRALLDDPHTVDPQPMSSGGAKAAVYQGRANEAHQGDPALDTGDFHDRNIGNLRVDYVVPSANLKVEHAGVFWPAKGEPGFDLVGKGYPPVSSDHRLVWVDVSFPVP